MWTGRGQPRWRAWLAEHVAQLVGTLRRTRTGLVMRTGRGQARTATVDGEVVVAVPGGQRPPDRLPDQRGEGVRGRFALYIILPAISRNFFISFNTFPCLKY